MRAVFVFRGLDLFEEALDARAESRCVKAMGALVSAGLP